MEYEAVIGLEVHIQLNTITKIFCSCKVDSLNKEPNINICPICTGMPGVLPVLNKRAVEKATKLAAALNFDFQPTSNFDRKNYFYPDLPKGYQISQFDLPLAKNGYMEITASTDATRHVNIWRLHLEEDPGKTRKVQGNRLLDFNRSGIPLVEMVTAPDLKSADEAAEFLVKLRHLLRWIDVSEAEMENGHIRCDANVSLRPVGETNLNEKTEIKNVNSIESLHNAIETEIKRQLKIYKGGGKISSWTLEWDQDTLSLKKMRPKETEADYGYFREPDLLPLFLDNERVSYILADLPELPSSRRARFIRDYRLQDNDAEILTSERSFSNYFEMVMEVYGGDVKRVANWLINDVLRLIKESGKTADELALKPAYLADIIRLVDSEMITTNTGKILLEKVNNSGRAPKEIVESDGMAKVTDENTLRRLVEQVIMDYPVEVARFKAGKANLMGWFVGQVMRETKGKADVQKTKTFFEELLN